MTRRPINDDLRHVALKRQRKYVIRKIREGKCRMCGKPQSANSSVFCDFHLERDRQRRGLKPWRPGGIGRPPKKSRS